MLHEIVHIHPPFPPISDRKYEYAHLGSGITESTCVRARGHKLISLVSVSPFANLADRFMVLCDFLGRAHALKAIYCLNSGLLFAMQCFSAARCS